MLRRMGVQVSWKPPHLRSGWEVNPLRPCTKCSREFRRDDMVWHLGRGWVCEDCSRQTFGFS